MLISYYSIEVQELSILCLCTNLVLGQVNDMGYLEDGLATYNIPILMSVGIKALKSHGL